MSEKTYCRAWKDTETFRKESRIYFWMVEVVGGGALFGIVGSIIGIYLTPANATLFWQNAYPIIGAGIGVVIGFIIVFALIFLWNLFRAPYLQRDEAIRRAKELEARIQEEKKQLTERAKPKLVLIYQMLAIYTDNVFDCRVHIGNEKGITVKDVRLAISFLNLDIVAKLLGHYQRIDELRDNIPTIQWDSDRGIFARGSNRIFEIKLKFKDSNKEGIIRSQITGQGMDEVNDEHVLKVEALANMDFSGGYEYFIPSRGSSRELYDANSLGLIRLLRVPDK